MRPSLGQKIVLASRGTSGDVIPLVGLGKQLQALGHRPLLAVAREFEPLVRQHGLDWASMAPHFSQYERDLQMSRTTILQKAFTPVSGGRFVTHRLVMPYLAQACADLSAALEGADLLVATPTAMWARIVAHEKQVPWHALMLAPLMVGALSAQDPLHMPYVPLEAAVRCLGQERFRGIFGWLRNLGRPTLKSLDDLARRAGCHNPEINPVFEGTFSPSGTTVLVPPQMMRQPLATDLPGPVRYAGFAFFDGGKPSLPVELEAFLADGEPPLVFTMGSGAVAMADRYYVAWSAMCAKWGWRALFLSADQDLGHSLPDTQRLVRWVSVAALFPRCRAVINFGGIGTSGQIVVAGVPQIVVPITFDQPDNAARLARMGASLTVRSMQARGPVMEAALHRLVHDAALHRRARQLKDEINQVCGLETTARWLDEDLRRSGAVGTDRRALRA